MLGVDKGGQLNSFAYNSRKSMRWFARVGLELILWSCMSNAYILHKKNNLYSGTITDFRKDIIKIKLKKYNLFENTSRKEVKKTTEEKNMRDHRLIYNIYGNYKNCLRCKEIAKRIYGIETARNKGNKTKYYCLDCDMK